MFFGVNFENKKNRTLNGIRLTNKKREEDWIMAESDQMIRDMDCGEGIGICERLNPIQLLLRVVWVGSIDALFRENGWDGWVNTRSVLGSSFLG